MTLVLPVKPLFYGNRELIVAITGRSARGPKYNPELAQAAYRAGEIAAGLGLTVLTGGLSGVMEEAARGAKIAGGRTIGILPGNHHDEGNHYLDYILPSGIGYARNYLIASACDFMVALPGGTGTLEEICFAIDFERPVISWGSWEIEGVQLAPAGDEERLIFFLTNFIKDKMKQKTKNQGEINEI